MMRIGRLILPALAGAVVAGAAFAQPVAPVVDEGPARVPDGRALDELKVGAPPEGAPIAKGVPRGPGSLTGVWFNDQYHRTANYPPKDLVQRTKDGELPPFLPWAAEIQKKRLADAEAGKPFAGPKSRCLPDGVPMSMLGPATIGLEFIEGPKRITVLIEALNNWRQIRLDAKHPDDVDPSFFGHSVAHWQGDTLVVDTIGFSADTVLDIEGMPHSDALHVIERWRRISQDRMEVYMTIDDPKTFTHPWDLPRRTLKLDPTGELKEDLCTNQRNAAVNGVSGVQNK